MQPKKSRLSDNENMKHYRVPTEVQELVNEYKSTNEKKAQSRGVLKTTEGMSNELKDAIKQKVKLSESSSKQIIQVEQSREDLPVIDISTSKHKEKVKLKEEKNKTKNLEIELQQKPLLERMFGDEEEDTILREMKIKKPTKELKNKKSAFHDFIAPQTYATEKGTTVLMDYYDGIESHTIENLLYYLAQNQNENGSFGDSKEYELTAKIALLLSQYNKSDNDQYTLLVDYLQNATPRNNREKAIKTRILADLEEPYTVLINELLADQNTDGGVGIDGGYTSDLETTLEFAWALKSTNTSTSTLLPAALNYIVNQINLDGTVYYDADSAASLFLVNRTLEILKPFQTWELTVDGNSLTIQSKIDQMLGFLNLSYDDLVENGELVDQMMTLASFRSYDYEPEKQKELFDNVSYAQSLDGSFHNSLYTTVVAMQALPQSDLTITGLQATTVLENGATNSFDLTIKNQGYALATNMVLYDFFDNFNKDDATDLNSIITSLEPQTETVITLNYNQTTGWIGQTEFKYYIEAENELDYTNNWLAQTQSVASDSSNTPAQPLYFTAHKTTSNSAPAVALQWQYKTDTNRSNYVAMVRLVGETDWNYYFIDNTWNGVLLRGLAENAQYEVNFGVAGLNGSTVTYNELKTIQIHTTADSNLYTGDVSGQLTVNDTATAGVSVWAYSKQAESDYTGNFEMTGLGNGTNVAWIKEGQYEELFSMFPVVDSGSTVDVRVLTRLKPDPTEPVINSFEPRYTTSTTLKNQHKVEMWLNADDNVKLKEADFYLYNPTNDYWEYLETEAFDGDDIFYHWMIPGELLGTGYKLKAIAWDYQNNSSLSQEWGTFEIVDGSDLTGGLSILGMENGVWSLGDAKVIHWKIDTPQEFDKITQVTLYYDGVHSIYLHQNLDSDPIDEVSYTMPLESFYVSNNAYIKVIGCDVNSNCVTLNSDTFSIVDNTPPPAAPWNVPQQITNIDIDIYGLYRHFEHIRENPDGSVEVIYKEFSGLSWEPQGEYRRVVYRKLVNGVWGNEVFLKNYWYRDGQTDSQSYNLYDIEQFAPNEIHMAYSVYNHTAQTFSKVSYMQIVNGSKVKDIEMSGGLYEGFEAQLAITPTNKVYVAWREGDVNNDYYVKYRELDGTTLSAIERLMTHSYSYGMTLDGELPIIAYHHDGQVHLIRKDGGVWTTPIQVNRKDIAKSKLDQYTEDTNKLDLIVEPDPNNADNYLWLNSVKTQDQLVNILVNNNFVKETEILEAWRLNEYAPDAMDYNLFYKGNNQYDLFYRNYDGGRSLTNLSFSIDNQSETSLVSSFKELIPRTGVQAVNYYRIIPIDNQQYNVFSILEDYNNSTQGTPAHVGHLVYYDETISFDTYVSSLVMDVGDWLFASENNDKLTVYYGGTIAGSTALMVNTADYSSIFNSSLLLTSPTNSSTVSTSVTLDWIANETEFNSYDVKLGLSPMHLETVASGLQNTQFSKEGLIMNATYYWKVIGNTSSGETVDSVAWSFKTSEANTAPSFEFVTPVGYSNTDNGQFNITWTDNDPEEDAQIDLYYDIDNSGYDGTLIVENLSKDDLVNAYLWNTSNEGIYYLYAVISDDTNEEVKVYSNGTVNTSVSTCSAPDSGDWNITEDCILRSDTAIYANIFVSSGATLLIDSNVMLELNSSYYKIFVEKGSLLKVIKTAKVKTSALE